MAGAATVRSSVKPRCKPQKEVARSVQKNEAWKEGKGMKSRFEETRLDSSCSSEDSSRSGGSWRKGPGWKSSVKAVLNSVRVPSISLPELTINLPRCAWITPFSEPLYVSFHDEEWGVPVHDDRKLFELLVLSMALAERRWPAILSNRGIFRMRPCEQIFDNFDPHSVAKFDEKKLITIRTSGSTLLSEQKMWAVVENAKQMRKVIEEFGSFNHYFWSFVNHKPIANGFRYARQVPVKSPKAESISKDLMQRGFRCVGPTVIYSFMQTAGIVNDHLTSCFRFQGCISSHAKEFKPADNATLSDDK
ncbi:putative DNA-3-methyladenine glycosylase I [Dioscorea sansibarensis]